MLTKNQLVTLTIDGLSHEGDGIGRVGGMAVFAPMTAPGDVLEAKLVKVLKSHAYAIPQRMVTPSPLRVENDCPHFKRCGGCSLRHIAYDAELAVKTGWVSENLRRIGGVDIALDKTLHANPLRYRNKAQFPVRRVGGKLCAGFFAKRSHALVPVEDCLLQPEFFRDIVACVLGFMEEYGVAAYDEETHTGLVRHIFIRYAEAADEAMLCLVINGNAMPHADMLIQRLAAHCPRVVTVASNENRERTNVIFGKRTSVLSGPGYITDTLCGIRVRLSAQSFYQVNRVSAELLYRAALDYANPCGDEILLDLYCGAGTIGLSMAHRVREVVGVEIVPQAVADAKRTALDNGIANARFLCGDASKAAEQLREEGVLPGIVVLDPPRKGADEALLRCIAGMAPQKIIYISCNSATLARDISRLGTLGYALKKARAADLFPRCAHVESVALLEAMRQ